MQHSLDETMLQGFFMLKLSDKALILPLMPHRVAKKCMIVHDFADNPGR